MKNRIWLFIAVFSVSAVVFAFRFNDVSTADKNLRSVLIEQLKTTHSKKDWFVPVNVALDGLTTEQALWKSKPDDHSAGQLAYHLYFWNKRQLETFRKVKSAEFSGDNEETFNGLTTTQWNTLRTDLDKVLTDLETTIANASEAQLKEWAPTIANISTHNAYHTGQIVSVRKLQGSWDPDKGVK